jgi:urease subunit gamma/beta
MPSAPAAVTRLHSGAMQLNPTEEDRLRIFTAAQLARATLERGLRLNATEAIALVCDQVHMAARAGGTFDEAVQAGRAALGPDQVIDGVSGIVREIRVEALFDEGTRLVVIRDPFGTPPADAPGAIRFAEGDVALVPDRERRTLTVTNAGDKPIRVSSHFPFWQTNPDLSFDREAAEGFRLDLPAGDSMRWAPGETKDVSLVAYGTPGA